MTTAGWLPADVAELFGPQATAEEAYEVLTVDVPPTAWTAALETARDRLGCTYFDWLSAVDEPGTGFRVAAHVAALSPVRRLLLRTTVPHESPVLPTAVGVYAGAAWHERETHEMFGVVFEGHPALDHLLLPEGFEGHPLRKDFVLAARVAKAWPGAKEPGESDHGGPRRRQMLPPGVPDPNEWGPLKGQLPPAPARPARGAGRTGAAARAAGDRPVRRTRTAAQGSASQESPAAATEETAPAPAPRRARSASEGSASQRAAAAPGRPAGPRRARSASEGSASQRDASPGTPEPGDGPRGEAAPGRGAAGGVTGSAPVGAPEETASTRSGESAAESRTTAPRATPRSPDAPWHHARPAFGEPGHEPDPRDPQATPDQAGAPRSQDASRAPAPAPEQPQRPAEAGDGHPAQPERPAPEQAAQEEHTGKAGQAEQAEQAAQAGQDRQAQQARQAEQPERPGQPERRPEQPAQPVQPEEPTAPRPPEDPRETREAREGGPQ
ncbi:NADH-quinone oxidoreductase subunit C [Streptomyces sp. PRKS01-65]|nr:NADH-quinone oxidoreductase subunit C [Streptomyces harenosi]NEY36507.1 NADH-quinone oxidoreductase subunit C [Streptomyces harenosi]